eukprot:m.57550 g.57550  ORF g.57550 m.57550 type:complete len:402 (+) comp9360_c0_seq1:188-1393(+)
MWWVHKMNRAALLGIVVATVVHPGVRGQYNQNDQNDDYVTETTTTTTTTTTSTTSTTTTTTTTTTTSSTTTTTSTVTYVPPVWDKGGAFSADQGYVLPKSTTSCTVECESKEGVGSYSSGTKCETPFLYNDKYHYTVVNYGGENRCPLSVDPYTRAPTEDTVWVKADCFVVHCQAEIDNGADCIFPYFHDGVIHHQCRHDTVWRNEYWCPTAYSSGTNEYDYNWTTWGSCNCERAKVANPLFFDFTCCAPGKTFADCPVRYGWQTTAKKTAVLHTIGSVLTASAGLVAFITFVAIAKRQYDMREAKRIAASSEWTKNHINYKTSPEKFKNPFETIELDNQNSLRESNGMEEECTPLLAEKSRGSIRQERLNAHLNRIMESKQDLKRVEDPKLSYQWQMTTL